MIWFLDREEKGSSMTDENNYRSIISERIEVLRKKLLDTTRRNPLINNSFSPKTLSFLRIVDEKPQSIVNILFRGDEMQLSPLPKLDSEPADEEASEFQQAYSNYLLTDEQYSTDIDLIDFDNDQNAYEKQEIAERALKDKVREWLEYPPRVISDSQDSVSQHAKNNKIDPSLNLPVADLLAEDGHFDDDILQTLVMPKTFQAKMARIFLRQRTLIEEKGLPVLFLTIGYLDWKDTTGPSELHFKSPIILLPVSLIRKSTASGQKYSIKIRDEACINPVLIHKLSTEFGIIIENIDSALIQEDIESVLTKIKNISPQGVSWAVMRQAAFGIYPFQGMELYNDLDTSELDFSKFSNINHLMLGGGGDREEGFSDHFDENDTDNTEALKLVPKLVLDADSSQFLALMKVAAGKNVALEGPPGSGKSQTIVNAIANAISQGKRVLFVAQKTTALEVVFSRLHSLGLSTLILPLMGEKSSSSEFYTALSKRVEIKPKASSNSIFSNKQHQLNIQKEKLNSYIKLMSSPVEGTDLNVQQTIGLAVANQETINQLPDSLKKCPIFLSKYSPIFQISDISSIENIIEKQIESLQSIAISDGNIWYALDPISCKYNDIQILLNELSEINSQCEELVDSSDLRWLNDLHAGLKLNAKGVQDLAQSFELLRQANVPLGNLLEDVSAHSSWLLNLQSSIEDIANSGYSNVGFFENARKLTSKKSTLNAFQKELGNNAEANLSADNLEYKIDLLKKNQNQFEVICSTHLELSNLSLKITLTDFLSLIASNYSHNILPGKSVLSNISTYGLSIALEELKSGFLILKSIYGLLSPKTTVPARREVMEWSNTISASNVITGLFSSNRTTEDNLKVLFGSTKLPAKPQLLGQLSELEKIVSEWNTHPLGSLFENACFQDLDYIRQQIKKVEELKEVFASFKEDWPKDLKKLTSAPLFRLLTNYSAGKFASLKANFSWEDAENEVVTNAIELEAKVNKLHEFNQVTTQLDTLEIRTKEKFDQFINSLDLITDVGEFIDSSSILGPKILGTAYQSILTDSTIVNQSLILLNQLADDQSLNLGEWIQKFANDSSFIFIDDVIALNNIIERIDEKIQPLVQMNSSQESFTDFAQLITFIKNSVDNHHYSDSVLQKGVIYDDLKDQGLDQLLFALEPLSVDTKQTVRAVIVHDLVNKIKDKYGNDISTSSGATIKSAREQLQRLDKEIINAGSNIILSDLVSNADVPEGVGYGRISEYTDLSLITKQLNNKKRMAPRKLVKRSRNALLALSPCWMMVPSSVASYLPREEIFDLVIIDEASQMTPENSISALMRAKQALVVGDTNQLPPTTFFQGRTGPNDEENEDSEIVEESILEFANTQFHPKHRLIWHYRSRIESLIAFSNTYIYNNELIIFPSPCPNKPEMGVKLVRANGIYNKGINPTESAVMLEAIVNFMTNDPKRSLGVVLMNQHQMEQLDTMILREAEKNSVVAKYIEHWEFHNDGLEKFFVKNLENVQGDERDVIFIGTVYGKTALGKFSLALGPLSFLAGKRRLNVLFTRAKEQIITFTSIPMDLMNPRQDQVGATLLKRWLEYSARGILGEALGSTGRSISGPDSPFEEHVIEVVEALGYEAIPQVGVSNYYIDIGIKHPSYPFGYICGVECDGASYHSSKNARDRDRLREEVLGNLGWTLFRIWSTDWFKDQLGQKERMKVFLEELLAKTISEMGDIITVADQTHESNTLLNLDGTEIKADIVGKEIAKYIEENSVFLLRYLDGPRAGHSALYGLVRDELGSTSLSKDITPLRLNCPLGEAVIDASVGEQVSYFVNDNRITAEILNIEDRSF